MSELRIVDLVFSRPDLHAWRRSGVAWAISGGLGLAGIVGIRLIRGPECECGVRVAPGGVKKELSIEVPVAPPPAPIQKDEPSPQRELEHNPTKQAPTAKQAPPAFAQAASIVAREAAPNEPLDLTGEAFVTGSGTVYSGGLTTSSGISSAAVRVAAAPTQKPQSPTVARPSSKSSQSRPVGLPDPSWTCPWPAGAESEAFDEQSAFVQVTVRQDGTVQSAVVLMDPGFGFGDAARQCALSARFAPALNAEGAAIHAVSPPIRVRFMR